MNVDLKILTRTLAKRMAVVLPKLIHENQRCIPGRKITKNIHIVQDLIDVINQQKDNAAFIFLDQEKAFDRISHKFMLKTLKAFGFGENFIKWVKIVYTDTKSQVKVNGFLTSDFSIQRGVRQGCPLSALLYVLCAEVLGIAIRNNKNIKGYKYYGTKEHKVSQYADDMNVVITTLESLFELFNVLKKYESATNAKLNKSKTEALWVGKWKDRNDKPLGLKWTNDKVKFIGVYVGNDRAQCSLLGFSEVLDKVKTKLSYWKGKFLTLKGKVKVLNIFVLSKLWYVLECQDFPTILKKDLDKNITDFVWNDIHQRELDVLYRNLSEGGLNLQDSDIKMSTFRIKWLCELLQSDPKSIECFLANQLIGNSGKIKGLKLLHANKNNDKNIDNLFYKNALKQWRKLNAVFRPGNIQDIQRDWIYDNNLLMDENGNTFKCPSRCPAYAPEYICDLPVTNHPREFKGVFRNLIPKINKAFMKIVYNTNEACDFVISVNDKQERLFDIPFYNLYHILLGLKPRNTGHWVGKWEEDTGITEDVWPDIWANANCKMLNYKVQSSLWETLHRNFMCAYFAKIAFNDSGICMLCKSEQLGRTHIFLSCSVIVECYAKFQPFTNRILNIGPVDLIERAFGLRGQEKSTKLRNYVNFCIRHVVYRNRNRSLGSSLSSTVENVCNKIRTFIQNDLIQKYDRSKATNKVNSFEEVFLIGSVLGKIEDRVLTLADLT